MVVRVVFLRSRGKNQSFIFWMSLCLSYLESSHFTFNIVLPTNCTNMFGIWLNGIDKDTNAQIRVGTFALMWSLWNCENNIIFNKKGNDYFLQVIHMATHWNYEWSFLLSNAQRAHINSGCNRLKMVARDIFNKCGWRLSWRIQDACKTFQLCNKKKLYASIDA
jgi:hypothetical protein